MITDDDYPYRAPPGSKTWQSELPAAAPTEVQPMLKPIVLPPARPSLSLIIGGSIAVLSVGNVLLVPIADTIRVPPSPGFLIQVFCVLALAASIGAQASLLAILMVYAAGPLWLRLVWHWTLAVVALLAWCLGYWFIYADSWRWGSGIEFFVAAVCGLPLVALACQVPHWLMRIYFYWRIEPADADCAFTPSRPLAISDFLVGSVVVGVAITAIRFGKPHLSEEMAYWTGWSIGAAGIAGITLAVVLPAMALILRVRDWRLSLLGVTLLTALATTLVALGLIYLVPVPRLSDRMRIFFGVSLVSGFIGALAGTLGVVRWFRLRLVTTKARLPAPQEGAAQITAIEAPSPLPPVTPITDS